MILLDTNVVSELMRPRVDPVVLAWVAGRPRSEIFTTSITKAEILQEIAILPSGLRKTELAEAAERIFSVSFAGRVLAFDDRAATHYGEIGALRRRAGRPISTLDAQIAAIALTAHATIATRDAGGFDGCGIEIVNPWAAARPAHP